MQNGVMRNDINVHLLLQRPQQSGRAFEPGHENMLREPFQWPVPPGAMPELAGFFGGLYQLAADVNRSRRDLSARSRSPRGRR